jgi:hypothetical protein
MTEASKITLSTEEQQLVTNTNWILTKRSIIEKAGAILGNHAAFAQEHIQQTALPAEVISTSPKIAKGENYLQLPWVMLDYPRLFERENSFAVRAMFWWGNFFSTTLQLSGRYKKQFENKLKENSHLMRQHDFFVCTSDDAWQHHFNEDNYTPAASLTDEEVAAVFSNATFIKIACKYPLQQWNQMPLLLQQSFKTLLKMLED